MLQKWYMPTAPAQPPCHCHHCATPIGHCKPGASQRHHNHHAIIVLALWATACQVHANGTSTTTMPSLCYPCWPLQARYMSMTHVHATCTCTLNGWLLTNITCTINGWLLTSIAQPTYCNNDVHACNPCNLVIRKPRSMQ